MQSLFVAQLKFPHRMNKNGTIDSICPRCYATIATSTWEADLDRIESGHVCEPSRLSHFDEQRRKSAARQEPPPAKARRLAQPWKPVHSILDREPAVHPWTMRPGRTN